jgi:ABC-type transport system involved in cytochrome bd biosynthesis fused ATPase/permease subunit
MWGRLLILDEATAGLDAPTASGIETTLASLTADHTLVLLGHLHRTSIAAQVISLDPQGPHAASSGLEARP